MLLSLRHQYFSLSLPSDWSDASESDVIAFANQTTGEELIVAVHTFVRALNEEKCRGLPGISCNIKPKQ